MQVQWIPRGNVARIRKFFVRFYVLGYFPNWKTAPLSARQYYQHGRGELQVSLGCFEMRPKMRSSTGDLGLSSITFETSPSNHSMLAKEPGLGTWSQTRHCDVFYFCFKLRKYQRELGGKYPDSNNYEIISLLLTAKQTALPDCEGSCFRMNEVGRMCADEFIWIN